jgi:hypothetical protein
MTLENPHAGQGMVVLDIGGDVGALVVSTPPSLDGREIEICPAGHRSTHPDDGGQWWIGDWHNHTHQHSEHGDTHPHGDTHSPAWPHVGVLARPGAGVTVYAAVYPGLRTGEYELWLRPDGATALTVAVVGGAVTSADWPG